MRKETTPRAVKDIKTCLLRYGSSSTGTGGMAKSMSALLGDGGLAETDGLWLREGTTSPPGRKNKVVSRTCKPERTC